MSSVAENKKRIARNTLLLYFRMLLTMLVSLYTVQVVLNTLGVVDYGIYNVVSGVVVMFSFLSNSMASASQRFFAFDLGRNDAAQLKRTFSLTVTIYIMISLAALVLAETVGLWFLNTQMVIPSDRLAAANWIYQFSILSFLAAMMAIPYNAVILAHEDMGVYAYVSIIEVALKLAMVYLLLLFSMDKLKLYAVLMFTASCAVSFIYVAICRRRYEECRFRFLWDRGLFRSLISYSGWNLFGSVAMVLNNQGVNILLNIFFGPVVNAARGIAFQVNAALNQFVLNFHAAVKPQITKYYAAEEKEQMMSLVFMSSKYSYFLLFILSMPVLVETHFLLQLWLKSIPEYVVLFTRLVIICALIDSLSYAMQTAAQATGNIRFYQTVVGGMLLFNLPVSYALLRSGFPPQATMVVAIAIAFVCLFLRLWMLRRLVDLPVRDYVRKVLARVVLATAAAFAVPLLVIFQLKENFTRFVVAEAVGVTAALAAIFLIGMSAGERRYVARIVKSRVRPGRFPSEPHG